MRAILVAVALNHAQVLVATDPLYRWQVHTGLHQVRDGGIRSVWRTTCLRSNPALSKNLVQSTNCLGCKSVSQNGIVCGTQLINALAIGSLFGKIPRHHLSPTSRSLNK
jgi:hypothetical protein